ncbi:MAG: PD40 domain-containing protein [Sandaracinaceae bacterium]|nr:PD40 domain-containing protein [Sandaracinaceae bacterium]
MNRKHLSLAAAFTAVALVAAAFAFPVVGQDGSPPMSTTEQALPERVAVIDVDSPERSLYRIAVPNLRGEASLGPQGAGVLRNDFRLISLFEVLDARSFVADLDAEGLGISPGSWGTVGAQGVVKGEVTVEGNQIVVQMRFYEVARGAAPALSRTYRGGRAELRQFMHDFANEVVALLTGRAGAFGTRITFARRRSVGRKDVMVATFDGDRVSRVSSGQGIAMLPAFGRGGVWYSILTEDGMFVTRTGISERPIIEGGGLNMGVSICGDRVFFSSTRDGNSEIYSANLEGGDIRRLTDHPGIDVSPTCGGPGGRVAFVSTRHGSPQIFSMTPTGGDVTRITYRGSHNQTPAWCTGHPDGPLLAFTGRSAGFDVFVVNTRTQQYTRLTQGQGTNKDPAFSPDCRMVAFYSSRGGIFISSPEGLNQNLVIPGHAETLRWSR